MNTGEISSKLFRNRHAGNINMLGISRVVSEFLSSRFHPKSRRLFPFYFSNITLKTDLTFSLTGAVFKIGRLPAYFDNPE